MHRWDIDINILTYHREAILPLPVSWLQVIYDKIQKIRVEVVRDTYTAPLEAEETFSFHRRVCVCVCVQLRSCVCAFTWVCMWVQYTEWAMKSRIFLDGVCVFRIELSQVYSIRWYCSLVCIRLQPLEIAISQVY